ncbi:PilZ domain-containing protein [Brevundimonas sp.]|uniref:PilZ domain-containing protein n=1 Tax=Brevundimonas sp. TaxID=1871086 RepID=UPI002EDB3969
MPGLDNRRRERRRIAVTAQIVYGPMRESHAVVVRNMHEGGAKVRLTATRGVTFSGRVVLKLETGDRCCAVVWQAGDEIGLQFLP